MKKRSPALYESEAAMCAQFMDYARAEGWTPYAETAGWDILLAHSNGYQIGVQPLPPPPAGTVDA